ncbi:hypothetical protein [Neisseria montereyensis]|uniref:Uncharacterized protein n=1 Tax=Neisseria montereyensis TaxID=2973938 RepID=A0ABT2FAA0_9NEIS|nr:hypothetical protein [Neisseria montereyensis]MCS4533087.1 hypothetical protein [Neisseria montereyensis]
MFLKLKSRIDSAMCRGGLHIRPLFGSAPSIKYNRDNVTLACVAKDCIANVQTRADMQSAPTKGRLKTFFQTAPSINYSCSKP